MEGFLQQDGRRYSSFGSGRQIASFILNSHKAREPAFRSNEKVEINNAISYFHLKMKKWENCAARFFEALSLSLSSLRRIVRSSFRRKRFPSLFSEVSSWISFGKGREGGVFLVRFIAAVDAFLVGSLIQRAHSRYRDDRVRQRSLLVSREKSARLLPEGKRDSSEFRVIQQQLSRSTRNARFPCIVDMHASLSSFASPLDEISISFRGN